MKTWGIVLGLALVLVVGVGASCTSDDEDDLADDCRAAGKLLEKIDQTRTVGGDLGEHEGELEDLIDESEEPLRDDLRLILEGVRSSPKPEEGSGSDDDLEKTVIANAKYRRGDAGVELTCAEAGILIKLPT